TTISAFLSGKRVGAKELTWSGGRLIAPGKCSCSYATVASVSISKNLSFRSILLLSSSLLIVFITVYLSGYQSTLFVGSKVILFYQLRLFCHDLDQFVDISNKLA